MICCMCCRLGVHFPVAEVCCVCIQQMHTADYKLSLFINFHTNHKVQYIAIGSYLELYVVLNYYSDD